MGWPKGKPRGPRKKVAAKAVQAENSESLAVTFGENAAPEPEQKRETAKAAPAQHYRNTRKAAVFCSQGKVEFGQAVSLPPDEAAASPWWKPCQKPD